MIQSSHEGRDYILKFKRKSCNSASVKQAWWSSRSSDRDGRNDRLVASNKNKITIECHGHEDHIFLRLLSLRGPMTGWTFESRESRFIRATTRDPLDLFGRSPPSCLSLPIPSIPENTIVRTIELYSPLCSQLFRELCFPIVTVSRWNQNFCFSKISLFFRPLSRGRESFANYWIFNSSVGSKRGTNFMDDLMNNLFYFKEVGDGNLANYCLMEISDARSWSKSRIHKIWSENISTNFNRTWFINKSDEFISQKKLSVCYNLFLIRVNL